MKIFTQQFWKNMFQAKSGIEMPSEIFRYPDDPVGGYHLPDTPKIKIKAYQHNLGGDSFNRDQKYYSFKSKKSGWAKGEVRTLIVDVFMKHGAPTVSIHYNNITRKKAKAHNKMAQDVCDFEEMEGYDSNAMIENYLPETVLFSDMSPLMWYADDLFFWYLFENTETFTVNFEGSGSFSATDVLVRDEISGFRLRILKENE